MNWLKLTGVVVAAHALEDVLLLSIGRFVPLPLWAVYALGLGVSSVVLAGIISKVMRKYGS